MRANNRSDFIKNPTKKIKTLSLEDELDLIKRYQETQSPKILNEIILLYTPFLKNQCLKRRFYNFSYDELFNESCLGLIECLKKFDVTQKNRLSTFLVFYVGDKLTSFIRENYNVISTGGMNHSNKTLTAEQKNNDGKRVNPTEYTILLKNRIVSTSTIIGDSDSPTDLLDLLYDHRQDNQEDLILKDETRKIYDICFNSLDERKKTIIQRIVNGEKQSDIAIDLGVTQQRIQQLVLSAFKKMKITMDERNIKNEDLSIRISL